MTVLFNVLGVVVLLACLSVASLATREPAAAAPAAGAEATIEATQAAPTPAEPLPGFDATEPSGAEAAPVEPSVGLVPASAEEGG